jgi:hypothetical protein
MSSGKPEGNVAGEPRSLEGLLHLRHRLAGEADRGLAIFTEAYGGLLQVQREIGQIHYRDPGLPVHPPAWLSTTATVELIRNRINSLTASVAPGPGGSGMLGEYRYSQSLADTVRTQNEGLLH